MTHWGRFDKGDTNVIDDDREEMPPFGLDHKMLWGMGFGPLKRAEILDALYKLQQQQMVAGLPILGVRELCNFTMPVGHTWPLLGTAKVEMTPSQGERWRRRDSLADSTGNVRRQRIPTVTCPNCNFTDHDVCFAPNSGFIEWHYPKCGQITDLIKMLGITYGEQLALNISGEAG